MALNIIPGLKGMTDPPMQSANAYASGTAQPAGRGIMIAITTAGTVTLTMADGSSFTITLPVGTVFLPLAVQTFTLGTAAGAAANLW